MKKVFINSIIIFLLCFLIHYMYNFFKLPVLRIFLPTNESIFSHIKMLFTASILFSLFEKGVNKYPKALLRGIILCIILLAIYIPIYLSINENLIITLIILFISIILTEFIISITIDKKNKFSNKIKYLSITLILLIYYIFLYLTDKPLDNFIFTFFK